MTESTVLKGTEEKKNEGSWVYSTQGVASEQGFDHVSSLWYPQTLSYDEAEEQVVNQRKTREDITFDARHVTFTRDDKSVFVTIDGRKFLPNEWSARQLCNWFNIPQTLWTYYMGDTHDGEDIEVVLKALRNGQRKYAEKGKKLLFRTYKDGTLRGIMSEKYSTVDNLWYIALLRKYIPNGRCSHWRGDADTIFGNVLIPDTIRTEKDSDFGGMLAVSNCEIGKRVIGQRPSIFSAICMNGCIWGETKGDILRKRHIGIDLDALRESIRTNIHKQIPLLTTAIPLLLNLHTMTASAKMSALFAAIAKRNNFTSSVVGQFSTEWKDFSNEKTAYGLQDAITRAGQKFNNDIWVKCDEIAGSLVSDGEQGWKRLNDYAKSMTDTEIAKVYGVEMD